MNGSNSQPLGQPYQNQGYGGQPMGQPPYPGQQYPNQHPGQLDNGQYQNQPYNQMPPTTAMQSIKQPMNPAKKKKVAIIIAVCSGVAILGIIAIILVPVLLRVDYSSAYKLAKDLKPKIEEIYYNYNCDDAVYYVDSEYTSQKIYDGYIDRCLETFSSSLNNQVIELGETDGVKRDANIRDEYDDFVAEYNILTAGGNENLKAKLSNYKAWHNFISAKTNLGYGSSSDADFTMTANYLINSGNEALASYGSQWLEKVIDVSSAYRAYSNASWADSSDLFTIYDDKYDEFVDWIDANKPDIKTLEPLNFDDTSELYSAFNVLYDIIAETYSMNYNSGSGDCTEFLGEVYCE